MSTPKADALQRMIATKQQSDSFLHGILEMLKRREVGLEGAIESARAYVEHQMTTNPCAPECTNDCESFNREAFDVAEERARAMIEAARRLVASADLPKRIVPVEEIEAEAAAEEAEDRQRAANAPVVVDASFMQSLQQYAASLPKDDGDFPTGMYL